MQTLGQEQLKNGQVLIILKSLGRLLLQTAKSFDSERKSSSWNTKGIASEMVSYPLSGWTTKKNPVIYRSTFFSWHFSLGSG